MAIFFIFFLFKVCVSCSAHVKQDKVKVLEDYVVLADFDSNLALPQLKSRERLSQPISLNLLDATKTEMGNSEERNDMPKENMDSFLLQPEAQNGYQHEVQLNHEYSMDKYGGPPPDERDLVGPVPHHAIASASSLFAIGFITFLILLSSLQSSLSFMIRQPTLLGSITKPLKRKRRFLDKLILQIVDQ